AAQQIQQLCNLFEIAAERKLRSGRVLDEDAQIARRQVEAVHGLLDGQRDTLQAFFPAASAKRTRMQNEELGAKGKRPLHLAAKRRDGFGVELRIAAREIHQVVGVNDQRLQSVALAKAAHLVALRACQFIRSPLPRAGGKNLEGVAAQAISALRGILDSSGGRGMDADPPRSEPGWPLRRWQQLQ